MLKRIHHAAIICSDHARSRHFYTEVLGLRVVAENFRAQRQSHKLGKQRLESLGVAVEAVRLDEYTQRRFVFFADPDGPPLELYEAAGG